ncbi:MAG: preprotein translocase subunit SecA, partial [Bacteroidetes bacterium]
MLGFLNKLLGGSKSEKDVKKIQPFVGQINQFFKDYETLSNDALRGKTAEFRQRLAEGLADINQQIADKKAEAEGLAADALSEKDAIYQQVDVLLKDRNVELERLLMAILPEAFANCREAARRALGLR